MSRLGSLILWAVYLVWGAAAAAQQIGWVQIEARPTESQAIQRAQDWAGRLPNVNGFALPSGWFAIALGPFDPLAAEAELRRLIAAGAVPRDSFVSDGRGFSRRIFGDGEGSLATLQPTTPPEPLEPAEESISQSRAAERLLSREERAEIQEALQWEGFYSSNIDASFGSGTRRAMSDWQFANGFEPTGILSTAQRHELIGGYREALASLGMKHTIDLETGIEISIPTAMVEFKGYEPPFAHFDSKNGSGVRVLLISQSGDESTLIGLYDVMQTLEIVPIEGPRERGSRSFSLTGLNEDIVSTTYAELTGGTVKGFTLVWPANDEKRRTRALQEMRASFSPTDGVLPDLPGRGAIELRHDLLSGLQIRQPARTRSGFFVDGSGRLLTSSDAVVGCTRITINDEEDARVVAEDAELGVALLEPQSDLVPIAFARFQAGIPRLQTEIAVAGFPFGSLLPAPTLTFGRLADLRGLRGEESLARLALVAEAGEAGGPVLDNTGSVLGVLLARETGGTRQLPPDVSFAADAAAVATFLSNSGVTPAASDAPGNLEPEDLGILASDMTVLVSCWN